MQGSKGETDLSLFKELWPRGIFSNIPKSFLMKLKGSRSLLKSFERIVNVLGKVYTLLSPDQTRYIGLLVLYHLLREKKNEI